MPENNLPGGFLFMRVIVCIGFKWETRTTYTFKSIPTGFPGNINVRSLEAFYILILEQ